MSWTQNNDLLNIHKKNILFLDLETTGVVKNKGFDVLTENRYPDYKSECYEKSRMIQIAYILLDNFDFKYNIDICHIKDIIIIPNNFEIKNSNYHGISQEYATNNGSDINNVMKKILKLLNETDYIIGYNIYFDINILLHEFYQLNINDGINKILDLSNKKQILCVAELIAKNCITIVDRTKIKNNIEKETVIYKNIFGKELKGSHNAKNDIFATIELMYWVFNDNFIYVKDALKNYYGSRYTKHDYTIYKKMKKYNFFGIFLGCSKKISEFSGNPDGIFFEYDIIKKDYLKPFEQKKDKKYKWCLEKFRTKIENIYFDESELDSVIKNEIINENGKFYSLNREVVVNPWTGDSIYCDIKEEKTKLNVIAYNLFKGESETQINYIKNNAYDVLFLSECSDNITDKLENYIGNIEKSHCGYTYIGVNKKITNKINQIKKFEGSVLIDTEINNIRIFLISIHLFPGMSNTNNQSQKREKQLNDINEFILTNNLDRIPIIYGGDTNMRNDENNLHKKYNLIDVYDKCGNKKNFLTYPNRNFKNKSIKYYTDRNFRLDKFYVKNCYCDEYNTIDNNDSDHLAICAKIYI